jgi:hypothetical protein
LGVLNANKVDFIWDDSFAKFDCKQKGVDMKTIKGTYFKGQLKLDKPYEKEGPVRVSVIFEENSEKAFDLADFSFLEMQKELKDVKGSFSDEVIKERRKER